MTYRQLAYTRPAHLSEAEIKEFLNRWTELSHAQRSAVQLLPPSEQPAIKIMRLSHAGGLALPTYATAGAAGIDLCAALVRPFSIWPGCANQIPTGFAFAIPPGWEAQIRGRSGMAVKRVVVTQGVGTIDSDYRGEIMVLLSNFGDTPFEITHGQRIAQMVIARAPQATLTEVTGSFKDFAAETERGAGGFGSTGA